MYFHPNATRARTSFIQPGDDRRLPRRALSLALPSSLFFFARRRAAAFSSFYSPSPHYSLRKSSSLHFVLLKAAGSANVAALTRRRIYLLYRIELLCLMYSWNTLDFVYVYAEDLELREQAMFSSVVSACW